MDSSGSAQSSSPASSSHGGQISTLGTWPVRRSSLPAIRFAALAEASASAFSTEAGGGAGARVQRVPQSQLTAPAATHQGVPHPQQHRAQAGQGLVPVPQVSRSAVDLDG
uniref:Uncharacterized protein n=1 Tax=Arundo donax TaxID=35708 RepID=A0A0A9AKT3_ARUDO